MEKKAKIFLNMILEENEPVDMVKRSIDSVKDHVQDIYITVTYKKDIPSKDSSLVKLLEEYKAHITYFKWTDDFSEARQYAMDQVPKGEYSFIYWQDADDVLKNGEFLPSIVSDMIRYSQSAVFFPYRYMVDIDSDGNITEILVNQVRERLIVNDDTFKWIGALHETLIEQRSENIIKAKRDECEVVHLSNSQRGDVNVHRNVRILEKMLEKERGKDPRTMIYLAKGYYDLARMTKEKQSEDYYNKAITLFYAYLEGAGDVGSKDYIVPSGWNEERATAWGHVAEIAIIQGYPEVAIEAYEKAIHEAPEFPNFYIDLASVYVMLKDYKKAKQYLLLGAATPMPDTTIVTYPKELKKRALNASIDISLYEKNLDQALESSKMLVELLPEEKYPKETLKEVEDLIEFNRACQSIVFLGKYLEQREQQNQIEHLIESIPAEMQQEDFVIEMKHRFLPPRKWESNEIAILCGPGWEKWSPKSLITGIGGSEEAVIRLSKELAKLGWKVTVYGDPREDAGEYNGVIYKHWRDINPKDTFNVLILWRSIGFIDVDPKAALTLLWLHDVPNNPEFTEERLKKIDKIAVLSEYHKSLLRINQKGIYKKIPDNKIFVTGNGITDINVKKWKGDPKKIVYMSSPDRGLIYLLKNWKKIIKEVPDAELNIFYGFETFDALHKGNPERMKFKEKIMELMKQPGITYHGRVGHDALHYQLSRCGVWAYPTDFEEISCCVPGTRITTQRGDVEIEDLKIDDNVLTHTGEVHRINKLMKRSHADKIYTFKVQSGDDLTLTGEHPLYVIRGKDVNNSFKDIELLRPEWIEARDVKINDCVLYPRTKSSLDGTFLVPNASRKNNFDTKDNDIRTVINASKELSWWLGYFAGDGSASERTGKVSVLVANKHPEHIQFVLDGFASLGLVPKKRELNGCTEYFVYSYRLARALKSSSYEDKLKILHPVAQNQFGLDGLLAADGHTNSHTSNFTNKSLRLIGQVRKLLAERGLFGKVQKRIHKNKSISYSLSWTTEPKTLFYGVSNEYIIKRIKDIEISEYDGNVYNIEVEKDNSYVANGHIVHNCISAMKAQACGAIPVVTNYAALQETVKNGIRVDVDITDQEGQDEYVKALVSLLNDEKKQEEIRNDMMTWAKKHFDWKYVASDWDKLLRIKIQNPEKTLEITK